MASAALSQYPGKRLVYIGEARQGVTADARFFDLLDQDWEEKDRFTMPRWVFNTDDAVVYERRMSPLVY
jgi:hypothetical protein